MDFIDHIWYIIIGVTYYDYLCYEYIANLGTSRTPSPTISIAQPFNPAVTNNKAALPQPTARP